MNTVPFTIRISEAGQLSIEAPNMIDLQEFEYLLKKAGIQHSLGEGTFVDVAGHSYSGYSIRTFDYWKKVMAVIM